MRILQVLPSVDARMGGTAEAVLQLSLQLERIGCSVEVATLDDPTNSCVLEYPLSPAALGPSLGTYSYSKKLAPWLNTNAARFDAVIVNGLWQYHGLAVWRALRGRSIPYYVFPHGMLDPWFRHTYPLKHLKKWMYWPWAEYRILRDARSVLFTSDEERLLARQSFWLYKAKERIVTLGINSPPSDADKLKEQFLIANPPLRGKSILLFMSRIHEKKGCDLLIRAFAGVARHAPALRLVVAGPDETGLTAKLMQIATELGVADRVSWLGMLQGDMKWGAFYGAQAFVLPSHQENFGVAVVEAMSCGLPVLISDKVNIWREIAKDRAGFVAPDSLEGTATNLAAWLGLDVQERREFGARAATCFRQRFTADATARSLLRILEET